MIGLTTPAGEAMREAVAQWFVASLGKSIEQGRRAADDLLSAAGPIASEFARLTAERDEARAKLATATETYTDDFGYVWSPPTAWAYFAACRALSAARAKDEAAEAALTTLRADHAAEVARLKGAFGGIEALRGLSEVAAPGEWSVSGVRRRVDEPSCVIIDAPSCPVLLALPSGNGAQALEALRDASFAVAAVKFVRAALAPKETTDA